MQVTVIGIECTQQHVETQYDIHQQWRWLMVAIKIQNHGRHRQDNDIPTAQEGAGSGNVQNAKADPDGGCAIGQYIDIILLG